MLTRLAWIRFWRLFGFIINNARRFVYATTGIYVESENWFGIIKEVLHYKEAHLYRYFE